MTTICPTEEQMGEKVNNQNWKCFNKIHKFEE